MLGVHTGILFGNYKYGNALGLKLNDVPILIGINWFIVVYACGMSALQLRTFLGRFLPVNGRAAFTRWIGFSLIFDGA
jgi:putative membrane protein